MKTASQHAVGILADDLTSAADGAAPFVARGDSAWVGRNCVPRQDCTVVAIDSGSRSLSEAPAAEAASRLTGRLASCRILYKTVDSTLRGHVAVELEASFRASGRKMLVFAPAFPAAGRTTVGGVQLVHGVPVARTDYGRDPVHPAHHSALADLVPASIDRALVLDASTQDELDTQVAALSDPEAILWVGSPGLALALARRFRPNAQPVTQLDGIQGDVLVAIGSANPCSHRQADRIGNLSGVTLLRCPEDRQDDPASLLRRIAKTAAESLNSGLFGALIATGGDTMEAILDRLGIQTFQILQELEPGFPLGRAHLGDGHTLFIAMKAGGFGDDNTLWSAVTRLHPALPLLRKVIP